MIFNNDTHLPSSVKLWHIPHPEALPTEPECLLRVIPLDAHDTSYFADSASTVNFSNIPAFINFIIQL